MDWYERDRLEREKRDAETKARREREEAEYERQREQEGRERAERAERDAKKYAQQLRYEAEEEREQFAEELADRNDRIKKLTAEKETIIKALKALVENSPGDPQDPINEETSARYMKARNEALELLTLIEVAQKMRAPRPVTPTATDGEQGYDE